MNIFDLYFLFQLGWKINRSSSKIQKEGKWNRMEDIERINESMNQ